MADTDPLATSPTLLSRLRHDPTDQAAWGEFVDRYGRKLFVWCRQWGAQETDAEDVTQNVLLELARQMRTFVYQPSGSFRSWLRTIAYRAWCDFLAQQARPGKGSGDSAVWHRLQSVEAREDLLKRLEAACDEEMLEKASLRVRQRVEPRTWEAFRLTALEGLPGATAAQQLDMQVVAVFKNKSRVQKMLQDELRKLEEV